MGIKKTTSLKASFWKFLCMLLVGLLGAVAVPFGLILAGTNMGFITYANYIISLPMSFLCLQGRSNQRERDSTA